ncbi:MAG: CAP domain-containing protein [bacterium]|nr:CAP domain-containing protein [bacterium]
MKAVELILHFFTPRHTNNHRPVALSFSAISTYICFLLIFQIGLAFTARFNPEILGYATNITVSDLLKFSNEKRRENGTGTLTFNEKLAVAAEAKAADMFSNQYWAHTSPAGRDPWSFIINAGYSYLYAGENLARDFADSKGVVEAWMNSPTHRENLLNSRYKEVGFAIANNKYGTYETTLVVQMFGTPPSGTPTVEAPVLSEKTIYSTPSGMVLNIETTNKKTDYFGLTKAISLALTLMLVVVLAVDAILVYRRQTVRVSGHNLAHMMILLVLLVVLNLVSRGVIL